jgi:mono/diheme cytochrome c family protein
MKRGRQSPWLLQTRQELSTWAVCVLLLTFLAGCGRERQTAAANPGDSTQASARETVAVPPDTTLTPRTDTSGAPFTSQPGIQTDTTAKAVKPAPRKRQPTPSAPKPAAAKPPAAGSSATATQPTDTSASSAAPTSEASAPLRDQYHRAPLDTVSQEVYNGWKQFNLNCARCHGEDVQGTTIAPHLIVSLRPDGPINTKELFVQTVCAGRPAKGMPSWCALGMDMDKINQIYSYVKGRSDAKIHPGRPAVNSGG